jgi:hypothetical protein
MAAGSRDAKLSESRAEHRAFLHEQFGAVSFFIPNDEFQMLFSVVELKKEGVNVDDTIHVAAVLNDSEANTNIAAAAVTTTSTTTDATAPLLPIKKGYLMNDLCDKAYRKYPHSEGKWPSHTMHREIINFIDDESRHTIAGIRDFASSIKL